MTEIETEYYKRLALQEEYGGSDKPVNRITPLVSVVTITYQHALYIRQCLDSILMQETDFPFELIIGEDGSTDGTREICIDYANRYPDKIRLFLRDRTLSQYVDKNGRIIRFNGHFTRAVARGQYVAICEGDDFWLSSKKIQKQIDYMGLHSNCSLCAHNAYRVVEDGTILSVFSNIENNTRLSTQQIMKKWLIPTSSIVYRRASLDAPSWELRISNGDLVIQIELSTRGSIYYFADIMGGYRIHKGSLTHLANTYIKDYIKTQIELNIMLLSRLKPNIWPFCIDKIIRYSFSYIKMLIHNP